MIIMNLSQIDENFFNYRQIKSKNHPDPNIVIKSFISKTLIYLDVEIFERKKLDLSASRYVMYNLYFLQKNKYKYLFDNHQMIILKKVFRQQDKREYFLSYLA